MLQLAEVPRLKAQRPSSFRVRTADGSLLYFFQAQEHHTSRLSPFGSTPVGARRIHDVYTCFPVSHVCLSVSSSASDGFGLQFGSGGHVHVPNQRGWRPNPAYRTAKPSSIANPAFLFPSTNHPFDLHARWCQLVGQARLPGRTVVHHLFAILTALDRGTRLHDSLTVRRTVTSWRTSSTSLLAAVPPRTV